MHPRTHELLEYLARQRDRLRAAFDAVPPALRDVARGPGEWSPAQVIEHVSIVNRGIAKMLSIKIAEGRASLVREDPDSAPVLPTLAIATIADRSGRFEAPAAVWPTGLTAGAA
jgi:DinB superfamily